VKKFARVEIHSTAMNITHALSGLLIAPLGSVIVAVPFALFLQHIEAGVGQFLLLLAAVWVLSLAAGLLFVMPFFVCLPRSRNPPMWVAMLWGAAAAVAFALLLLGSQFRFASPLGKSAFIVQGAVAGMTYVAAVRRGRLGSAA
jgi:hypothetical protein